MKEKRHGCDIGGGEGGGWAQHAVFCVFCLRRRVRAAHRRARAAKTN
jgi:hypothetical protein